MSTALRLAAVGSERHLSVDQLVAACVAQEDDAIRTQHQAGCFLVQRHQVASRHSGGFGQTVYRRGKVGQLAFDHERHLPRYL